MCVHDHDHDTYTAPTPEPEAGATRQAPPALTAPAYGRGKRTGLTVCILAAIFIAVCLALSAFVNFLRAQNEHPAWRTLRAVLPGADMLETMAVMGGNLQFEGVLGPRPISDMVAVSKGDVPNRNTTLPSSVGIGFGNQLQFNRYGEFHAQTYLSDVDGSQFMDLDVLLRTDGLQIGSNTLLGDSFTIPFEGLVERLEASVFKPGSGSNLELNGDTYERFLKMARAYDPTVDVKPSGTTVAEAEFILKEALSHVLKASEGKLTVTQEKRDVRLINGTAKAKVYTYSFDETYVLALTEALRTEWRANSALKQLICNELRVSFSEDEKSEAATEAAYGELTDILMTALDEIDQVLQEEPFEVSIHAAIKSRYLVCVTATLAMEQEGEIRYDDENPHTGSTLSLVFSSNPDKNPAFTMDVNSYVAGAPVKHTGLEQSLTEDESKSTRKLVCTATEYDQKGNPATEERLAASFEHRHSGAFMLTVKQTEASSATGIIEAADRETTFSLTVEGDCSISRLSAAFTIEYIELYHPALCDRTLAYTNADMAFYMLVQAGDWTSLPALAKNGKDPTTMKAEELSALREQLEANVESFKKRFETCIGKDVFDMDLPW